MMELPANARWQVCAAGCHVGQIVVNSVRGMICHNRSFYFIDRLWQAICVGLPMQVAQANRRQSKCISFAGETTVKISARF
jgi:hypothetical protein